MICTLGRQGEIESMARDGIMRKSQAQVMVPTARGHQLKVMMYFLHKEFKLDRTNSKISRRSSTFVSMVPSQKLGNFQLDLWYLLYWSLHLWTTALTGVLVSHYVRAWSVLGKQHTRGWHWTMRFWCCPKALCMHVKFCFFVAYNLSQNFEVTRRISLN